MADQVRIGFIGCGGNAGGHMRRLSGLPDARIVAVCDVVEERAKQAAERCQAEAYTDYQRMLGRSDLDAVYLSLPVFAHGEPEMAVIERGLPFLVEKPVARTMQTARRVEEAVRRRGLMTAVGYQLRYMGGTEAARQELSGKTVNLVVGKYWCGSGRGNPDHWVRQMALSGGQLVEQATHTVDAMRYLLGEVKEVYTRRASRQLLEIDCADTHVVTLEFESGALGSLTATWAYDPADWGHANVIDISYDMNLLHWGGGKVTITANKETRALEAPDRGIDEVFVEAVKTKDPALIRSPYSDAVKTLAVTLAMNESADVGRPVRVATV